MKTNKSQTAGNGMLEESKTQTLRKGACKEHVAALLGRYKHPATSGSRTPIDDLIADWLQANGLRAGSKDVFAQYLNIETAKLDDLARRIQTFSLNERNKSIKRNSEREEKKSKKGENKL